MAHFCDRCRQLHSGEPGRCPHCAAANGTVRNGTREGNGEVPSHESDAEIDLASPVAHAHPEFSGPPSGASFASWTDKIPAGDEDRGRHAPHGPGSRPRILSGPSEAEEASADGEIDLDVPPSPADGPPSGASFTSWTALVRPRDESIDDAPASPQSKPRNRLTPRLPPPRADDIPDALTARALMSVSPEPSPPLPRPPRSRWLAAVIVGLLLGILAYAALWWFNAEPGPSERPSASARDMR